MIAVDASAVAELLLSTESGKAVGRALTGTRRAHAPELLDPEALGALSRMGRRGKITPAVATRAVRELAKLPIVRHGHAGCVPAPGSCASDARRTTPPTWP